MLCNKTGLRSAFSMHNSADGQTEIKASLSNKLVMTSMYFDWRQHPVVLLVCAKVQYMSQTERSSLKKTFFKRSGLSKLSCVLLCTYIHSVRLSGRKTSLQATVVSMVTGRVEVREEVERTGCSESVREEVGDAYRRS